MKQTAVEWLVSEFTFKTLGGVYTTDGIDDVTHLVEQAKEMEKEQMCLFVETFEYEYFKGNVSTIDEHYDKTFKTNEK
jgi:hypothetical protein